MYTNYVSAVLFRAQSQRVNFLQSVLRSRSIGCSGEHALHSNGQENLAQHIRASPLVNELLCLLIHGLYLMTKNSQRTLMTSFTLRLLYNGRGSIGSAVARRVHAYQLRDVSTGVRPCRFVARDGLRIRRSLSSGGSQRYNHSALLGANDVVRRWLQQFGHDPRYQSSNGSSQREPGHASRVHPTLHPPRFAGKNMRALKCGKQCA